MPSRRMRLGRGRPGDARDEVGRVISGRRAGDVRARRGRRSQRLQEAWLVAMPPGHERDVVSRRHARQALPADRGGFGAVEAAQPNGHSRQPRHGCRQDVRRGRLGGGRQHHFRGCVLLGSQGLREPGGFGCVVSHRYHRNARPICIDAQADRSRDPGQPLPVGVLEQQVRDRAPANRSSGGIGLEEFLDGSS